MGNDQCISYNIDGTVTLSTSTGSRTIGPGVTNEQVDAAALAFFGPATANNDATDG